MPTDSGMYGSFFSRYLNGNNYVSSYLLLTIFLWTFRNFPHTNPPVCACTTKVDGPWGQNFKPTQKLQEPGETTSLKGGHPQQRKPCLSSSENIRQLLRRTLKEKLTENKQNKDIPKTKTKATLFSKITSREKRVMPQKLCHKALNLYLPVNCMTEL